MHKVAGEKRRRRSASSSGSGSSDSSDSGSESSYSSSSDSSSREKARAAGGKVMRGTADGKLAKGAAGLVKKGKHSVDLHLAAIDRIC